ncbi:transglutaminaseTgpA domain-containing protein [Microcella daejeonensis]|uniref:transglutaminaseTgpA domain-containing protein n=1 Tax=Microcella daejeonensis TaxID=2994971 RepID=UPI0022703F5A|nr:transglutaminaseTgpA domain-containing protein [Microcella daejeonensis]WAB83143.1 transglutaminaseTgpA domain-containing protein [Microcella daejeonensis]
MLVSAGVFTLLSWAAVAAALWPIYQHPSFLLLAGVAVPLGVLLVVGGLLAKWRGEGVLLAAVALFIIVGVPLAVPGRALYGVLPEPQGLLELVSGVVLGWRQLVTIELPVADYQALLVPALVLLLAGPVLTASIALRTRRPALAALVPLLAFALAVALGSERVPLPAGTAVALAVVLLLWLVVQGRHRRADAVRSGAVPSSTTAVTGGRAAVARPVVGALILLLLSGGIGAAAVAIAPPEQQRTVLRSLTEPPFDPRALPSPLAAYRTAFLPGAVEAPAVRVSGLPSGARLRVATLDSYDGVVFAVGSEQVDAASGRFERIPTRRDVTGIEGDPIEVDLVIEQPIGPWLPTIGEFAAIRFDGDDAADVRDRFVVNDVTGTAALIGGVDAGRAYRLTALQPVLAPPELDELAPGAAAVPAIAAVPDELRTWFQAVTVEAEGPGPRLAAAIAALQEQGYISHGVGEDEPPSRSGHSLDRLAELVTARPMLGDAEQYAAAAALLAREAGFPSRVVLGYAPAGSGDLVLRGADLTAWIEIDAAGLGWIPVDVMPPEREIPPAEPDEPIPVTRPQNAVQPPVEDPPVRDDQAPPEIEPGDAPVDDSLLALVLLILTITAAVLLALGLIAAPFIGIVAAKARRRRRRRRKGDAVRRILAGWREVTDAAVDRGIPLPAGGTRRELALAIGRPQAAVLARVADRADYAPEAPPLEEVDRVWQAVDAVRASLAVDGTRRERWRAAVSTRSLRRYPGRARPRGGASR